MDYFLLVILAVVYGCMTRLAHEGPTVEGKPHRIAGDFGFTGIRIMTSYVLLWVVMIPAMRKDWSALKLWLVSYLSFQVWQLFAYKILSTFDLDPSGHIHCTIIALSLAETQF